jgi:hypothetical protein
MVRAERERMQWMVTWLTQLEWQMDRQGLMEWRRMKAEWYRETGIRRPGALEVRSGSVQ